MKKYKIILSFNEDRWISDIESILLDDKPTKEEAEKGRELYKADYFRIIEVENN